MQLGEIKEKVELLLHEKKELEVRGRMLQQNLQGFHKHLEALSIDEVSGYKPHPRRCIDHLCMTPSWSQIEQHHVQKGGNHCPGNACMQHFSTSEITLSNNNSLHDTNDTQTSEQDNAGSWHNRLSRSCNRRRPSDSWHSSWAGPAARSSKRRP